MTGPILCLSISHRFDHGSHDPPALRKIGSKSCGALKATSLPRVPNKASPTRSGIRVESLGVLPLWNGQTSQVLGLNLRHKKTNETMTKKREGASTCRRYPLDLPSTSHDRSHFQRLRFEKP